MINKNMFVFALFISCNVLANIIPNFKASSARKYRPVLKSKSLSVKDLGTRKNNFHSFSSNIYEAVMNGLPSYNEAKLARYLRNVYKISLKDKSNVFFTDHESLQRFFGLPLKRVSSKVKYVESDQRSKNGPLFAYAVDGVTGESFVQKNVDSVKSPLIDMGEKQRPIIEKFHDRLLRQIGVNPNELLYKETSIMSIKVQNKMGTKFKTYADSFVTYGLRKYNGIMVEESFVKLYNKNTKVFSGMELNWPKMNFHQGMNSFVLKNKKSIINEVIEEISQTQKRKSALNIRMAIVLRPVKVKKSRTILFVPSVKVGVYSKDGEAGNMFYVDLSQKRFKGIVNEDSFESSGQKS